MKKEYKIGIGLLSLFAVIVTTAHSFSMVTKGAQDASFTIAQAKTYYLKGSFNDWAASSDYLLADMTATMGEEENKINEYTITKDLAKDATLKIWDSSDYWYEQGVDNCSYVDKWGRVTETSANYTVPMTGTYNIYLKFYSTGAKQVYLAAPDITKLYFKPNANWSTDSARFAAYFFQDETTYVWDDLTLNGDYYEVNIPTGYPNVIFCRMDPSKSENSWDNKWNQTADLNCGPTSYQSVYELAEDAPWDNAGAAYWRAI